MKIKSIYIDGLHNTHSVTYTFNDLTYFHGRNGAGKSTILNAIQLALLGYIPGTSKTKAAILRHSKDNSIVVKLVIDDNGQEICIDRIFTENLNTVNITPEGYDITKVLEGIELPIFNFNEFVGQTANKLKDYFIKNILPVNNGSIKWKELLTNSISTINMEDKEEFLNSWIDRISEISGTPLEQAVSANNMFKEEKSACDAELKSLQGAIDSLIFYDDYTGSTDISDIDNQIRELSLLRDSLIAYRTSEMQTQKVQEQITAAMQSLKEIQTVGDLDFLSAKSKEISELCEDITNKISGMEDQIRDIDIQIQSKQQIINSKGICPYTSTECSSISAKVVEFSVDVGSLTSDRYNISKEIDDLKNELTIQHSRFATVHEHITNWENLTNKINSLKSMLTSLPTKPNTDKTSIELSDEIKILQDNRAKAIANQKYNETIDSLTAKKSALELELNAIKAWVKITDTNNLQTKIMEQPFIELADKMTGYIQTMYCRDDIKAHFYISDKANSFSFGLIRGDKYIPYDLLSSGEKCLYSIALMICIIDNSTSPLKVLMVDDSLDNLDDIAIESTFESLKNISNIQFIMAGVKHCNSAEDVVVEIN